ncbi:MAG: PAS domain S-box protein [Myxococcales bacterium]|nr:PAS domain S-box protein [Myxococcales bacterium]
MIGHLSLHAAAQAAGIGLWDWDIARAHLALSPGWAQILGFAADEAFPDDGDWTRWVHPDDQARVQREGAAYVANPAGEFRTILRTRAKDGTWRAIEVRGRLTQLDGSPHLVGGLLDVTEPERTRVELGRKARALRLLTDANQAMMRASDEAALLAVACQVAVEVGGYRMAWVGLVDPTPGAVRPVAQAGFDEGYVAASEATWSDGRGPAATAIASDAPCIVRDIPTDPAFADRRDHALARGYRSAAALPIHVGGAVVGVFKVYATAPDAFDDAERAILTELAEDLSFALAAVRTTAARDRAERELRTLLDSFPDLIARFDLEGRVTYVSASVLRTGKTSAVIGRTPAELHLCPDPADTAALLACLRRVLATGETETVEVDFDIGGDARRFEVRHLPVLDDRGRVTAALGIGRDLSERRAAERQLYLLNYAIDAIGDGIYLLDGESPRIAYVNQAAADSLGYTRAELTGGMTLLDIDPGMTMAAWTELVGVMRDRRRMTIESQHRTRDGRLIPIEVTGNYFAFDGAMHNLAIVRDISERKAAEAARRASERQLETVTTAIDDVFWLADASRTAFSYVSPAFERVFGGAATCGPGSVAAWDRHIDAADRLAVRAAVAGLPEVAYDLEYRIRRRDGEVRWIHDRAVPIRDASGRVEQLAGVAADVTRRRALEEQLAQAQKMEAAGQLAGGIAHDFNNMLAVVQMEATMLREHAGDDTELRAGLDEIIAATERAANLTRQLLTFSRRQVARPVDLDLAGTLGAMVKLLRRVLGEHVALDTRFAPGLPAVHADPGMMEQLLMNLAINARDAMPDGGQLVVSLAPVEVDADRAAGTPGAQPGRHVALTVADTGTGIAPEHLPRIFEPFFTTKEIGKGTGLGLATVFGIVAQHHGLIEVASTPGAGTSFTVLLPALEAVAEAAPTEAAPRPAAGGHETLLLVEDDTAVRATTRAALEGRGYQVLEANSAAAALAIWAAVGPSIALVVTDLVMPGGVTGRQLGDILIAQRPDLRIVYTSGYSAEVLDQRVHLSPTHRFLAKPYTTDAIADCVRACLDAPPGDPRPAGAPA